MNITNVSVSDRRGAKKRPLITLTIDEMPASTNETITRTQGDITWTSGKYGPLIDFAAGTLRKGPASSIERYVDALADELSPSGWYNDVFSDGLAPVVDVAVVVLDHEGAPTTDDILDGNWAIQLRRARSLLRRFEVPWRLLMNDHDGQSGRLSWVPVMNHQMCCGDMLGLVEPYENPCPKTGVHHLPRIGIDYWLCSEHNRRNKINQFTARTSK